jgi:hypothetical protein
MTCFELESNSRNSQVVGIAKFWVASAFGVWVMAGTGRESLVWMPRAFRQGVVFKLESEMYLDQ